MPYQVGTPLSALTAFGLGHHCDSGHCDGAVRWVIVEDHRASVTSRPDVRVHTYCDRHRDEHGPVIGIGDLAHLAAERGQALPFWRACHSSWPRPAPVAPH